MARDFTALRSVPFDARCSRRPLCCGMFGRVWFEEERHVVYDDFRHTEPSGLVHFTLGPYTSPRHKRLRRKS